jgi:CheY-like chemotaxis protein
LLVEDNIVNQDVARFMLEACGCKVTVCDNGADAVLSLRKEDFDLVLMDCSMPGMDGYEATRRIRENEKERGRHTPIIALTANVLGGVREHCLRAGMDDYLPKPFSKSELLAIMREWLPRD